VRVGIIGCGLVGQKRAAALGQHTLVVCADVTLERAQSLARTHAGARSTAEAAEVIANPSVEAVIVATPHDLLAPTAAAVIRAGKHVLIEKPGGRTSAEIIPLIDAASRQGVVAKVGFNHRFHPALTRAHTLVIDGAVGDLMYVRARYGHGGRLGYEREWRADPRTSGGGELLDQGSHLIDLSRWFAGDVAESSGRVETFFWPMLVEDNAFVCLRMEKGAIAWLHASWTEWKNLFSFEVFGRTGKLQIDGLGGSYGTERLTYYRMLPELGPPESTTWEFPNEDTSWEDEFAHFVECVENGTPLSGSLHDALGNLRVVEELYRINGRDYHA
jgi:predicted dehydrogenase